MADLDLPLIVPGIRLDRDPAGEAKRALERARQPWCAGFCLFGGEAEGVRALIADLRSAADRPLFVASDMERGAGQQVKGLRCLPDAGIWGLAATPNEVVAFGRITAWDARSVGVDVLFAPDVDVRSEPRNPIVGNRSFGYDPDRVLLLARAFCQGALAGGALPVAKHYPGHGGTATDSHDDLPVVDEAAERIERRDIAPFLKLVDVCPAVMTAHVHYPTLDPHASIATFSSALIRLVRQGSDLVVFTDALLMSGALCGHSEQDAARLALAAGCDALLYPESPEAVAAGFFADEAHRARAEESAARLARFARRAGEVASAAQPMEPEWQAVPAEVAMRATIFAGDVRAEENAVLVIDDDDMEDRGAVLAQRAGAAEVAVHVHAVPSDDPDVLDRWIVAHGLEDKAFTIVLMSSVRAWKGPFSEAGRGLFLSLLDRRLDKGASVQLLALTPAKIGLAFHLPGGGPEVESALASRLFP